MTWLLIAITGVGIVAQWLRIPYAVALVLAGLALAESHVLDLPRLDPNFLLFVLLPPLLFDAAFRLDAVRFRGLLPAILLLAIPGTLFTAVVVGGVVAGVLQISLVAGLVLGLVGSRLTALSEDHLVEMTLSTALAYGSYLAAQSLESSGPLACVAAGLIHGSYGRRVGMSENARRLLDDLWEYLGFAANGLVFLLVGFTVSLAGLAVYAWPVVVAIIAVELARALLIGGLSPRLLPARLALQRSERLVLFWGGLRGALTMALALALPTGTPERDLIVAMAFGVVLFTLVVQGLTLSPLTTRLGFTTSARTAEQGGAPPAALASAEEQ